MNNLESSTVFKYTGSIINRTLNGISHKESLKEPELGGNSINWILGHLVVSKDSILTNLGFETLCDEEFIENYKRGTKLDIQHAFNIEEILKLYNEGHNKVMKALEEKPITEEEVREEIIFLAFHEAYHTGQIGILRRILGKDSIIK